VSGDGDGRWPARLYGGIHSPRVHERFTFVFVCLSVPITISLSLTPTKGARVAMGVVGVPQLQASTPVLNMRPV
jgi:hypothetical protein